MASGLVNQPTSQKSATLVAVGVYPHNVNGPSEMPVAFEPVSKLE